MKKLISVLLKILKISGITAGSLIALLFLAPMVFPDTVGHRIKSWTNQSITGDLNFSNSRLSFFNHFPSLTLTLYNVDLRGSAPFDKDTLLSARKLGFGINLKKLIFDRVVHVNKIFLTDARMNVQANAKGEANKINFKMRIGLPPVGIIGIPLRITGTSDSPKIKLGNKDSDQLEETEDAKPESLII